MQNFLETNLEAIFGVKFLKSEFSTGKKHNGRIDTIGLDENGYPVIIEYKFKEKDNIINQGLFYLDWLSDHKGDFQILVEEKLGEQAKKIKIDWSQPRLILIASSFNRYDRHAINRMVKMAENVELWEYSFYENNIFRINIIGQSQKENKKEKKLKKSEYKEYNLKYHLNIHKTSPKLQKSFQKIRIKILELPNVQEKTEQKSGITYRTTKSFVRFEFRKNSINILLRRPSYNDPQKLVKDVTSFEWGYKGQIKMTDKNDIGYLFNLIKQSYEETL